MAAQQCYKYWIIFKMKIILRFTIKSNRTYRWVLNHGRSMMEHDSMGPWSTSRLKTSETDGNFSIGYMEKRHNWSLSQTLPIYQSMVFKNIFFYFEIQNLKSKPNFRKLCLSGIFIFLTLNLTGKKFFVQSSKFSHVFGTNKPCQQYAGIWTQNITHIMYVTYSM